METLDAQRQQVQGRGSWRHAQPGTVFTLSGHPAHDDGRNEDRDRFAVLGVQHRARKNFSADAKAGIDSMLGAIRSERKADRVEANDEPLVSMNSQASTAGLTKLTGTITNYKVTRASASFVFTDSDRSTLGVVAVAAGLAGLGGQAISTASNATSAKEEADYVEFDLDGRPIRGWVWRSPLKEGDRVDVVGKVHGNALDAVAIARPDDRTIALYPHCSRGSRKHIENSLKWWLLGVTLLNLFAALVAIPTFGLTNYSRIAMEVLFPAALGFYAFFALMTFSLARKWMPFARMAEKVFAALGWPDPSKVDLVKSTKAQLKPGDPGELGTFYFRY